MGRRHHAAKSGAGEYARGRTFTIIAARSINLEEPELTVVDLRINPLAEVVLNERQRLVRAAVGKLDRLGQDVFLLHYWEELKTAEIAVVLDIPEGTVKTRLRRGREGLRRHLRHLGIDGAMAPMDGTSHYVAKRREEA